MQANPLPDHPDVLLLRSTPHGDARGFFVERFRSDVAAALGIPPLLQLNHSRSRRGTLRGLHYQAPPHAQGKLLWVLRGRILDAIVDLRRGSPRFGRAATVTLDEGDFTALWVPAGFAHGFQVLSEEADVLYHVDAGYAPAAEGGVAWDDADLAIPWPIAAAITSPRDRAWPRLRDVASPFP
jgi:dTDP-4-dehydrorhamnose 3,5-epimerase